MKLCMFHPVDRPMERGWPGRIDGDHVVELAAQTLQAFFTGGGAAREHAVFPLASVRLLAPVLHPPAVRVFEDETSFVFANPAAVLGPGAQIPGADTLLPRVAAVIGARGEIGGFTGLAEWRSSGRTPPKDRDFALGLGPVCVTPDEAPAAPAGRVRIFDDVVLEGSAGSFSWPAARDLAAADTTLRPGDILAGPALGVVEDIEPGAEAHVEIDGIGALSQSVRPYAETE